MSDYRIDVVQKSFDLIDSNHRRIIDIETVKGKYNPSKHPDVISRRKTEDEILFEFIETFDEFCEYLAENSPRQKIGIDDFIEYYRNLSMTIEYDDEFVDIINGVWKPEIIRETKHYDEDKKSVNGQKQSHKAVKRGIAHISSIDNTLHLGAKVHDKLNPVKRQPIKSAPIKDVLEEIKEKLPFLKNQDRH